MKRIIASLLAALTALLLLAACGSGDGQEVYVESVAAITGMGYSGLNNRYSGIIVSGSSYSVEKDRDKKILELYVEVGDKVSAGDVLFEYDVQAVELALKKLELECEQLENSLALLAEDIASYEKKVAGSSGSRKLEYEIQLQSCQIEEKEKAMELTVKQTEMVKAQGMLSNSQITSHISGVVQSINEDTAGDIDENGEIIPYITIIETGAFRVKGTASEMDLYSLREGSPVIIRSRLDDTTWNGTVEYIEWDNPEKNQNDYYYMDGDNSASRYPFHVALESTDGLILGQHVYIEPVSGESVGMMLPEYYICDAEGDAWVWAANKRDRIEKREIQLGEYDPDMCCYEITGGLTADDFIAFPDDTISEGAKVIRTDAQTDEDYSENSDMVMESTEVLG